MTFNTTNASLISSLSTFVAEAIAAERENNPLRITGSDVLTIKEAVLADLDDVDAEAVAAKISVCDIAELIDPSDIAKQILPSRIVREIDTTEIADTIAQSLDLSEIAQNIDASDLADELARHIDSSEIAQYVEVDHQELAQYVNDEELANQLATNDDFVESVAKAIANRPGEHTTVTADAVQVTAENMINDKLAAACDRIVERVTQRVLEQIGNTLVSLIVTGSKRPQ